jgi:TolB protein
MGHNGLIAYGSQRVAGEYNWLYLVPANGAQPHPLAGVRDVTQLAWSPDGRSLLFAKGVVHCSPGGAALYLIRADGSGLRRLTHDRRCYESPSWAPDGKRFAYASWGRDELPKIWTMRRDGRSRHRLTGPGPDNPAWSPDGRTIAYRAGFPEVIWLMDADGGNKRQLTKFRGLRGGDGCPTWSPNSRWLAFNRQHSPRGTVYTDIYKIRRDGTGFRQLTDHRGYSNAMPDWSPDGTRIVFASDRRHRHERSDIYVMNADGTQQQPLANTGFDNQWPAWQARR